MGAGALLTVSLCLVGPSIGHSEQAIEAISFPGPPDSAEPQSGVVAGKSGNLYGVSFRGGLKEDIDGFGVGTVFSLTPDPTHETLYKGRTLFKFSDAPSIDSGHYPVGGVIIGKTGTLYGVTRDHWDGHGGDGGGTIYALKPPSSASLAWDHNVLFSFRAIGGTPLAGLVIGQDGALYGTTSIGGGLCYSGTVFRFKPNGSATGGSYRDIYRFKGLSGDPRCPKNPTLNNGMTPAARLTLGNDGILFGTTAFGGQRPGHGPGGGGCGVVFSLTPPATATAEWKLDVLLRFLCVENGKGEAPAAAVSIGRDGSLYGTTENGGISPDESSRRGYGIVFQLTPPDPVTGKREPKNLWRFTGGLGGESPLGGVIETSSGVLYGTTNGGGRHGGGTIFRLVRQPSGWWKHEVLHHFTGVDDGAYPSGDLLLLNGALIGTTSGGGAHNLGTVYRLQVESPPT
jgi:uncharacterized repeat protein (TIGR03803 family)